MARDRTAGLAAWNRSSRCHGVRSGRDRRDWHRRYARFACAGAARAACRVGPGRVPRSRHGKKEITMKRIQLALAVIVVVVLAAASAFRYNNPPTGSTPVAAEMPSAAQSRPALPDFHSIVEQFGPAVVNVSTEGMAKADDDSLSQSFRRAPQAQVPV